MDPEADLSGDDLVGNLVARVEAGEWGLGQGLVATLRLISGAAQAQDALRQGTVQELDGTGIIEMAREYIQTGPDEQAKAQIGDLLHRLVFESDRLEAMSQPAGSAPLGRLAVSMGAPIATVEDCTVFFADKVIPPGVGTCLESRSFPIGPDTFRVYSPAPPLPSGGWTAKHIDLATTALLDSVSRLRSLGTVPAIDLVFAVTDFELFMAETSPHGAGRCGIVVYPRAQLATDGDFKQYLSHEVAHCFQGATFPDQDAVSYYVRKWRTEGLAEYLGNVVYPANNHEWTRLDDLQKVELSTTLLDRAYSNFLWFQYLSNLHGDPGMLDLIRKLPTGASGTLTEQRDAMAAWPGVANDFHEFAEQYTDAAIKDTSGASIPTKLDSLVLEATGPASPLVSGTVPAFGVRRYLLTMPAGKQADLALDLPDGGVDAHARAPSNFTWTDLPGSWPAGCDSDPRLRILLTSATSTPQRFELSVPGFLDLPCPSHPAQDPCLVGDWVADDAIYRDYLAGLLPGGSVVSSVTGTSALHFDSDGRLAVAFDSFSASYSHPLDTTSGTVEVEGLIVVNGRGAGGWSADGSFITYSPGDYAFTIRITLSINGVEIGSSDSEVPHDFAGAPFSSVRAYVCTADTLTETVEIAGAPRTVVWDRQ